MIHELEVECLATAIPDKLQININHLELKGMITVGQIEAPAGVKVLGDPEAIAVQCVEPAAEVEAEAGATEGAEPEVIGRKAEDEEAEEEKKK